MIMAPEVIDDQYGRECDIWSLGVLLYNMLSACNPFEEDEPDEMFAAIKRGRFNIHDGPWKDVSDSAKDLIIHMLIVDPKLRLTITGVLNHPWFRDHPQEQ